MADQVLCSNCDSPVTEGAAFCPTCGTPTPTEINQKTGEIQSARRTDTEEGEFRKRLQRALGDAYELRELIGRGGFGVVYAAWDSKLKREVAVKALRFDLFPTPELLRRFQREAEAVAKLRHPNIIPIYSVGEADGLAFMIMPRIEGDTLRVIIEREGQLSIANARRILVEAANALQAAHEAGVVHRDVKPENIILEGKKRHVLVMDFGIAKPLDVDDERLTGTGMIVGTPHYMSPEQATGDPNVDARTDQYSLAVVGYQLLTGEQPFDADSIQGVILKQITEDPTPVHVKCPEIPKEISDAIRRALAKAPEDRFPTLDAFAAAISTLQAAAVSSGKAVHVHEEGETFKETSLSDVPEMRKWFIGAGVLGFGLFLALYGKAFPRSLATPVLSRSEAVSAARDFLESRGAVGSFKELVAFHESKRARVFLERSLGEHEAREWVRQGLPVSHWHLRWFRPGQREEWTAGIGGQGTVVQYQHIVEETAPGANLSREDAFAMAESFLVAQGWSLDDLERVEASSQQRTNRTDHQFAWLTLGITDTLRVGDSASDVGSVRVIVEVQGNRIGAYRHVLKVPETFSRSLETADVISGVVGWGGSFVLFLTALVVVLVGQSEQRIRWFYALRLAGIVTLLFAATTANNFAGTLYDYSTEQGWVVNIASNLMLFLFLAVLVLGFFLALAVAMEQLGCRALPGGFVGYTDLLRGRLSGLTMSRLTKSGYLLAGILLGWHTVFGYVAHFIPGHWYLREEGYTEVLNTSAPFLVPLTDGLLDVAVYVIISFFMIVLFQRLSKSTWLSLLAAALLMGIALAKVFPMYIGVVESAVWFMILGIGIVHWGVFAGIVAAYCTATVEFGMSALTSGISGATTSGVAVLLLALLPLLPMAISKARSEAPASP